MIIVVLVLHMLMAHLMGMHVMGVAAGESRGCHEQGHQQRHYEYGYELFHISPSVRAVGSSTSQSSSFNQKALPYPIYRLVQRYTMPDRTVFTKTKGQSS